MKVTAKRDKFSGHWWIAQGRVSMKAYRGSSSSWDLCDVRLDDKSLISHHDFDRKGKSWVVYPMLNGQAVPNFCSLRAMINWIAYVAPGLAQL